jgi:hypothetical protein
VEAARVGRVDKIIELMQLDNFLDVFTLVRFETKNTKIIIRKTKHETRQMVASVQRAFDEEKFTRVIRVCKVFRASIDVKRDASAVMRHVGVANVVGYIFSENGDGVVRRTIARKFIDPAIDGEFVDVTVRVFHDGKSGFEPANIWYGCFEKILIVLIDVQIVDVQNEFGIFLDDIGVFERRRYLKIAFLVVDYTAVQMTVAFETDNEIAGFTYGPADDADVVLR